MAYPVRCPVRCPVRTPPWSNLARELVTRLSSLPGRPNWPSNRTYNHFRPGALLPESRRRRPRLLAPSARRHSPREPPSRPRVPAVTSPREPPSRPECPPSLSPTSAAQCLMAEPPTKRAKIVECVGSVDTVVFFRPETIQIEVKAPTFTGTRVFDR